MTKIESFIHTLPKETVEAISAFFGSTDMFYAVCYLIAKNEHINYLDKHEQWEIRNEIIANVWQNIETFLNGLSLNGKEILADIKSDYLEDFVQYKERSFAITNEKFICIIKKVQNLRN